jgi:hypothetical protein
VATQESHDNTPAPSKSLLTGLSMIGGLGITMATLAAAIGVVLPDANSSVVGLVALSGAALLVLSVGGWFVATQPHKHFDDINQPLYHGHHHEEHHTEGEEQAH